MKLIILAPISLFLLATPCLRSQTIPATDVADALTAFKLQAVAKIDQDLAANATAFADARNIQVSARWSDWFSPFLDIARAVYDGLTSIQFKKPNSVRSWVETGLQSADSAEKAWSFATGFDRFWQDGQNLQLAIDGPAYTAAVNAMLDRADETWFIFFGYESYRLSILNDLNGFSGSSPMRVARKAATVDRMGGQVLPAMHAAKNYIYDQLGALSTEMRVRQLAPARITEITAFIEARRRDLLNSRVGNSRISYSAYLLKGSVPVLCPVTTSLGAVTALEKWRITMLGAYGDNLDVEIQVRLAETADTALSLAADTATEMVSFNMSYEATIAGQAQANEILKDTATLGFSFAKPDVGTLFNTSRASASNAREQINMIPQQMMDALPGEVSKVLLLIDDTIQYVRTLSTAPPPTPTTTSVSPTSLPTSPSTQLINIYGANFKAAADANASSLIFRDPANNLYLRTPIFVSASQLQYNITVQSAVGTWSVTVTNAGLPASNPQTFTVVTPPPNTGSLVVNLSPAGAVAAGAQWQVDGGSYHNSGDITTGLTPGAHLVAFKTVAGYTAPASVSANIVANQQTTATGIYTVVPASTYVLTRNYDNNQGSVRASPTASGNIYTAGTVVQLTANPLTGYSFAGWSGDATGTANPTPITMDGNKSVTANFVVDTSMGNLRVAIQPQAAIDEGAQWKAFPFTSWYNSGDQLNYITPKRYYVSLKDLPGWVAPQNIPVDVVGGTTTQVTGTYQEIPGTVQVTIEPAAASAAGARWRLDGGAWQSSGATTNGVPSGTHQIEFQSISGWSTPASQPITVPRAGMITRTGQYTPPPGLTLITTISPKSGPIEGGTLLTIEGANFLASSAVFIGGRAASNITFLSTTRLTAVTPPSQVLGSAEIVVTTGTSSATNANAFAYGIARGSNMTLITSSGGMYQAVACNNQYLFIGQGTTFLVYDIANPANPIFVSSVTVPGLIQDIALSGNFAVVAANDAGVHVVDISNPAAPRLRGFYDTSGTAFGLKLLAGRAYVADVTGGLLILDVANPDAPTLLSSIDLGASTYDVALKNSVAGLFAIVAAQNKMIVVDVSNPQSPSKLSEVAVAGDNWSVALAGNLAFLGRLANGVDTVDISNLSSPVSRGRILTGYIYVTVAATGNTVALAGGGQRAFNLVEVSGVSTTARGNLDVSVFSMDYGGVRRMAIQNGVVWVAGGTAVFGVNISNLDAPQRIFRKDDQGGRFEKVASFGANIAATTLGKVLAFNASGSTLSPTASFAAAGAGQSCGFFFYGDTLFDVDGSGSGSFQRFQMQANGNLTPLTSLTISNVSPDDVYFSGSKLLSVGQTYPGDSHAVITEHNPSGANWILRQKQFSFMSSGGGVQIAGAQEFFFLARVDDSSGKWNLASYNWSAGTPTWQISGLENIYSLQLSHNNRFMHVGERLKYRIYDLLDPANPVCLSTNATTSDIRDILINGDEAYLAASGQGVLVYDIGDKSQPRLVRSYDTPGYAFSLAKVGDRLMVADYAAGIQVLGLPDIVAPQVFITSPVALAQFQTTNSSITLGGAAEDNSGQINRVVWSNDRGGGGIAQGTTDWLATNIALQAGTNVITATASDPSGNTGQDTLTVTYQPPAQGQTITFPALEDKAFGDPPIPLVAAASSGLPVTFNLISGPASISNSVLTLTGAGAVTVEASQAGNISFNPAPPVDVSFNVARANQSIAFTPIPTHSAGDAPFALTATASSGLPVAFNVISGPAISSSNLVTLLGGGTVTVVAWQPGNSNYNAAATVPQSFTVSKIPQTITFGALSPQRAGDAPFPLTATADSGLPVSFSVTGPATLSGNILTLTGWGTVTVTAAQPGNSTYAAAANVARSFVVSPAESTLVGVGFQTNGGFQLVFYGTLGSNYTLQASLTLSNWMPLFSFPCTNTPMLLLDTTGTNQNRRFYRITW